MAFTPRYTQPEPTGYYGSWNEYNRFPWLTSDNNYGGNCTGYAYGRTSEIAERNIHDDFIITGGDGDAADWIYNTWSAYTHTSGAIDIQLGDILVWGRVKAGDFGHVEVVEAINGNQITTSGSLFARTYPYSRVFYNRTITIPSWGSAMGRLYYNNGKSSNYSNPFVGYIHNKYINIEPQPDAPEIQITASSREIRIPVNQETGYATISIEVTKIPESESDPYPLRDMSSGLTREWITDGWELSTYTEEGTTYQRVYGKMRIIADRTAPDDAFVRFYQTYSSGYASATVNFNVIKETEKRTAILFLQYDGGAYEIR